MVDHSYSADGSEFLDIRLLGHDLESGIIAHRAEDYDKDVYRPDSHGGGYTRQNPGEIRTNAVKKILGKGPSESNVSAIINEGPGGCWAHE